MTDKSIPEPSFRDLTSIMKAAEDEANRMLEEPILEPSTDEVPMLEAVPEVETTSQVSGEDVKEIMKDANITSILSRMTSDPEELKKLMEASMKNLSPEAMQQARNLAMGGQGDQIRKEMQKRGLNPQAMRKQLLEHQKSIRGMSSKPSDDTISILVITASRQVKSRKINPGSISLSAPTILKTDKPVELSCSRLAQGPLAGKCVKIWYDSNHTGVNRRASKIIGFRVGGEMIVTVVGENLLEADFLAAEKYLA